MSRNPVSRVYSRALLEAAAEADLRDQVFGEMESLGQALDSDLPSFLLSPKVSLGDRHAVVDRIFEGCSPLFLSFLRLVIRKGRASALPDMVRDFRAYADLLAGRAAGTLSTAVPVSGSLVGEIRDTISAALEKQVQLEPREDPALLGGFVARIGDRFLDASLKTRLEAIRQKMKSA